MKLLVQNITTICKKEDLKYIMPFNPGTLTSQYLKIFLSENCHKPHPASSHNIR